MGNVLNSDRFLTAFNKLEHHFKNSFNNGYYKGFKQMLRDESKRNPALNKYKDDLFEMADLRNAIVHNRANDFRVIAEPHTFIVERLEYIANSIIFPEKMDRFCKEVITCYLTDPVEKAVGLFYKHQISQIPVLDPQHHIFEILNASNIAYWLAKNEFDVNRQNSIETCIALKEYKQNFEVISKDTSVYHAAELYHQSYKRTNNHKYFDAILITPNGHKNEPLVGIMVLSDIAQYL
jgi:predicted transcriptional regulator